MKLPNIKDLIKDKKVFFNFFRDGELWYITEDGFEFPILGDDQKGAIFRKEDKAILFMRFIRKHLDYLEKSMKEEQIDGQTDYTAPSQE